MPSTMRMKEMSVLSAFILLASIVPAFAQQEAPKPKPEDTEVWSPEPKIVTPGAESGVAPSDAVVLFDGKDLERVGGGECGPHAR